MKRLWARAWLSVGVLSALGVSGACDAAVALDGPPPSSELRVQLPTEPVSLDPALADDDFAARVLGNTIDGLVGYDRDGKLENRLAQSYKVSRDHKTYTFTLRKGALWSDGRPVRAEDFVTGIRRTLDPKTGARFANMLFLIRGAKEFNSGQGAAESVAVRAEGGNLVIALERAAPYFVQVLSLSQTAPARADILAANGGKWPENAPVTGPYVVDSHILEHEIHLTPNPRYWRFNRKSLQIAFKIIPEESTAQSLFENGQLDVVTRPSHTDFQRFKAKGLAYVFPQAATYYLSFNAKKPPFDDREFRRAVAGAVNRQEILDALSVPNRIADGWIPPELTQARRHKWETKEFAPSVRAIAERLKSRKGSATAYFNTNALNSTLLQKVQFDLRKVLGFDLQLSGMDWKSFIGLLRSDTPQMYRFQRSAPFIDAAWHLLSYQEGDPNNPTGWKNAEYDRLVDQALGMEQGKARQTVIEKAEKILLEEEAIVIPIFFANQIFLISKRVQGLRPNPINIVLFADVAWSNQH